MIARSPGDFLRHPALSRGGITRAIEDRERLLERLWLARSKGHRCPYTEARIDSLDRWLSSATRRGKGRR